MAMPIEYTPRKFTVDEYLLAAGAGAFGEDRTELLDGEVILMPPIGPDHNFSMMALNELLVTRLADRGAVLPAGSVIISKYSMPEPDFTIARAPKARYRNRHIEAADMLAVVEVSVSSLAYDRGRKRSAYARAQIPEYWIVDVNHERVEIYRNPNDLDFAEHKTYESGERMAFAAFPEIEFAVDEIV